MIRRRPPHGHLRMSTRNTRWSKSAQLMRFGRSGATGRLGVASGGTGRTYSATLRVEGRESTSVYQAAVQRADETVKSEHERHFCRLCGSHLWAFNERWPDLLHPVAGAIDTELPAPSEYVHMLTELDSRASWVAVESAPSDGRFPGYPEQSLAAWHQTRGLAVD
jgi:hypothetical protein